MNDKSTALEQPFSPTREKTQEPWETLGDFTTNPRVLTISALALLIGFVAAFVALALLRLIGLFTNVFYFGRWSTALVSPSGNHLGVFSVFVPIAGAIIIGLMARYGSERIRGHGIPEAIEAILINGSRVEPNLGELSQGQAVTIFPDEPLRAVVYRMAEKNLTRMPVVDRHSGKFLGLVSLDDLLKARTRHLEEERRRERVLRLRYLLPGGRSRKEEVLPVA